MPPHCFVCDRDLRDLPDDADLRTYFTLVQFALDRAEQVEQDGRAAAGVVGHPLGAVWFCHEHAGLAQARAELHWRTALEQIRAATGTDPARNPAQCLDIRSHQGVKGRDRRSQISSSGEGVNRRPAPPSEGW